MTRANEIARLGQIAQLILDVRLADLAMAAKKRQHSLNLLANLNTLPATEDLPLIAAHQAGLRYQSWAETRRAEINPILARQTAEMLVARQDAALAFGKNQALRGLQEKLR